MIWINILMLLSLKSLIQNDKHWNTSISIFCLMRTMLSTSMILSHLSSSTCISGDTLRAVNLWRYASEYMRHKRRNAAMWSQFQFRRRRRTSASRTQVYAKCHLHQQASSLSKNFAIKTLQQKLSLLLHCAFWRFTCFITHQRMHCYIVIA